MCRSLPVDAASPVARVTGGGGQEVYENMALTASPARPHSWPKQHRRGELPASGNEVAQHAEPLLHHRWLTGGGDGRGCYGRRARRRHHDGMLGGIVGPGVRAEASAMSASCGTKIESMLPRIRHVSETTLQNRRESQIALVLRVGGVSTVFL
uniref:Uncharacterized protein n=1 Tax=Oryza nivara TaxID=4536 RepID=A0A0E0ID66_ORYNI